MGNGMKSSFCAVAALATLALAGCGGSSAKAPPPVPAVHNEWTWVAGSDLANPLGSYGTQGAAAVNNIPGGRFSGCARGDNSGDIWLFGGSGNGSTESPLGSLYLNDLWKYSAGQWTWESGSKEGLQPGSYGTMGNASSGNVPGARNPAACWIDGNGSFFVFGGMGLDSKGTDGFLNDLWKYSGGQWAWVSGSDIADQPGSYAQQGIASAANVPASRQGSMVWTDKGGKVWLFGGIALNAVRLNDLWMFDGSQWTWVSGTYSGSHRGVYGALGTAAAGNVPGGRGNAMTWTDSNGNFWVFGGVGFDSSPNKSGDLPLNDLWKFGNGQWTWEGGSNLAWGNANYGTKGVAAATNVPGARDGGATWTDREGNFWLFGGGGLDSANGEGVLGDLWKYSNGQWTWMSGSNVIGPWPVFGTQGKPAAPNTPGTWLGGATWTDSAGNLWMFGGYGNDSANGAGALNSLMEYQP
jgi:N-acetylneuraminic acid mutarotase